MSWTDRILLKNSNSENFRFKNYSSDDETFVSDHLPVFIDGNITVNFLKK